MSAPNTIQDLIKAQLLLNNYFSDAAAVTPRPVPLITADDGDITNAIERNTAALKGGLAVVILIPVGENEEPQHGTACPKLLVELSFIENPLINRATTGMNKKAYHAARQAARPIAKPGQPVGSGGLHFWNPGPPFTRMEFTGFAEMGLKTSTNKTLLVYHARFTTTEMIS